MRTTIAAITAMSLALAACGTDESEDADVAAVEEPTTTTTSAPSTTTAAPTTTEPPATTTTTDAPEPEPVDEPTSPFTTVRPSDDEVVRFGAEMGQTNVGEITAFLQDPDDDGGPFYMVNMIRYRD
ncbi:MAG: hypothetical protein AAGE98_11285, partial [Actinomycetota bacterium]